MEYDHWNAVHAVALSAWVINNKKQRRSHDSIVLAQWYVYYARHLQFHPAPI